MSFLRPSPMRIGAALILLTCLKGPSLGQSIISGDLPSAAKITSATAKTLRGTLDDFFTRAEAHGFSGAVIVAQGETVILRKGYGFADRRRALPVTPTTAFDIASLDKQFIAAAILRLEEMGKLRTTDTLDRFFDFVSAEKRGITLHQLLTHTSGLPNAYWDEHAEMTRKEFVRYILRDQPLASPPGKQWRYSNSAFVVLEEIIEQVSGKPYDTFLHEALYLPAGMAHTGLPSADWNHMPVAQQQFWTLGDWRLGGMDVSDPLHRPRATWMVCSTVDDLFRWYLALRGNRILSQESKRKLFTPVLEDYAYGWNVVPTSRGTTLIEHGGGGTRMGMMATFRWFVSEDVFVGILSNSANPSLGADYFCGDVERILFGGDVHWPPASQAARTPLEPSLEGTYALPGGAKIDLVRVKTDRIVLRTRDARAMLFLRFPDAAAPPKNVPQDEDAASVFRGIAQGDFEPLRKVYDNGGSFETYKGGVQSLWMQWKAKYGDFHDVGTVYQRWFEFNGAPETQSFLRLQFERGDVLLRALRFPSGRMNLSPLNAPAEMEVVLAPVLEGTYSTWDFTLGAGATITLQPSHNGHSAFLRIQGPHGSIDATKLSP